MRTLIVATAMIVSLVTARAQDVNDALVIAAAACRPHVHALTGIAQPGWDDCLDVLAALRKVEQAKIDQDATSDPAKTTADRAAVRALAAQLRAKK